MSGPNSGCVAAQGIDAGTSASSVWNGFTFTLHASINSGGSRSGASTGSTARRASSRCPNGTASTRWVAPAIASVSVAARTSSGGS